MAVMAPGNKINAVNDSEILKRNNKPKPINGEMKEIRLRGVG